MSKVDRAKKRQQRRAYAKPSLPRAIGANDNVAVANDNLPPAQIKGVLLTPRQAARFYDADLKSQSNDPDLRKRGQRIFEELEREVAARLEAKLIEEGLSELSGLEALRGLEITRSKAGPRASRDGLETLLTAGSITRVQHAAGLRYRADYEMLDPERGLTPPALDQSRKITRGGDGYALIKRQREEFVRDLEAMIQEEDRTFKGALGRSDVERVGRAVWALREIAGKGNSLLSLSSSGSKRTVIAKALIVGLDCAAIAYGLE